MSVYTKVSKKVKKTDFKQSEGYGIGAGYLPFAEGFVEIDDKLLAREVYDNVIQKIDSKK